MTEERYGPAGVNSYSRPLDAAFADLAVMETPGHPNRGLMVDKYIRFVGLDPTGDIEDPIGGNIELYRTLATELQALIEQRLREKAVL